VTASVPVTGPRTVTLSPDGQFVYATTFTGMVKIDTATNTVVGTVTTGSAFMIGVAVTADGATAYVGSNGSGRVSVVDTATMLVIATLPIAPQAIATAPDGTSIWVVTNISGATMAVIDSSTNTFTTFLLGPGSFFPSSIAFTPDGAFAYLANNGANLVAVIDTASRATVATITAGFRPNAIAVSPDGAYAYVSNQLSNNVSVISTATNNVVATVLVGSLPAGLAFTPDGAFVYVANSGGTTVSVIDTATRMVVSTISVPFPSAVAMRAPVLTPQDQIADLIAQINALVAEGALAANRANPLITKLEAVSAKLDASQVGAACNQLGAFINQINAYIADGTLAPAQGQALIAAAQAIQGNLGCAPSQF